MRFWNNLKIRPKLLLAYTLGAVIPILVIASYLIFRLYSVSFDNSMQASIVSLEQLRVNYANYLENCAASTRRIARDPQVIDYVSMHYDSDFDAIMDFFSKVAILSRTGSPPNQAGRLRIYSDNETVYFSQETGNTLEELEQESWYVPGEAGNTTLNWVPATRIAGVDYGPGFVCYTPMYTSDGERTVHYVAAMYFGERPLHDLISAEQGFGQVVFLLDAAGNIVTSTERETLSTNLEDQGLGLSAGPDELQNGITLWYGGAEYYCQKMALDAGADGPAGWQLVRFIPVEDIRRPVTQAIVPGLILCLCCLLFGLTLILFTAHNIRARVHRLNRNMNEVLDSGFEKQVEISGADEIGDIERNFKTLAQQTDSLIHEVYEAQMNAARLQSQKTDAQLIALRGQINPHYLFNTLESIRMNLVVAGDRRTAEVVHLFAESFRVIIEDNDTDRHDLASALRFLKQYFAIQEYRMRGRVSLKVEVPKALMDCQLPKLMLQPLVENAVYHGLELKEGSGTVHITARQRQGLLRVTVADDGVGMDACALRELRQHLAAEAPVTTGGKNLALKNVASRLKLMYGDKGGLRIKSTPGQGTLVEIFLPAVHLGETGLQPEVN